MAPAKINLYLNILGKADNGYHNVEMVMQTISLCDIVTVTINNSREITISSNKNFLESSAENTAYKAAVKFFESTKGKNLGINIHIKKRIPICAGLAGGSADAAATLVALDKLFNTNLTKQELAMMGESIGADVPFCIYGGTMKASGIGTKLSPLPNIPKCSILLCKPDISISTAYAYTLSDKFNIHAKNINPILHAINKKSIVDISANLYNCFEVILNLPEIYTIKNIMLQNGAIASCMSGSGPMVFGIFDDETLALNCEEVLHRLKRSTFLCTPIEDGATVI